MEKTKLEIIAIDELGHVQGGNGLVRRGLNWAFGARTQVPRKQVLGPDGSKLPSTQGPSRWDTVRPTVRDGAAAAGGAAASALAQKYIGGSGGE